MDPTSSLFGSGPLGRGVSYVLVLESCWNHAEAVVREPRKPHTFSRTSVSRIFSCNASRRVLEIVLCFLMLASKNFIFTIARLEQTTTWGARQVLGCNKPNCKAFVIKDDEYRCIIRLYCNICASENARPTQFTPQSIVSSRCSSHATYLARG